MQYDAIVHGKIVTSEGIIDGQVIYDETGKIVKVTADGSKWSGSIRCCIDAKGAFVVPGGIDGHVHLGGFGEIPIADDFYTGSLAALAGGTTTVVDFCEPARGQDGLDCIRKRKEEAKLSAVDYAFHFVFTENYKQELEKLPQIQKEGIGAYKLFTYYDNTALSLGDIREILGQIYNKGTVLVHAEEMSIIECMQGKYPPKKNEMLPLALTRPDIAEETAVQDMFLLAKESKAVVCIAHTSTGAVVEFKRRVKNNKNFCLETCPHYLAFTEDKLIGGEGALYTMNPPLRKQEDRELLWQAMLKEEIAMLSTDHCPYLMSYKYGKDYRNVPCGVDGIQTRMLYLFSEGVQKRGMSMETYVRLTSENAAKFYQLYPRKGCIAPGSDADFTLISKEGITKYGKEQMKGATDYTIFEGSEFMGTILLVIKGGQIVYDGKKVNAIAGSGQYLPISI